jgi:hypothetical protein
MLSEYDRIITDILLELDKEQAAYQQTHKKLYGECDEQARLTYLLMIRLCERIKKEIMSLERK